MSGAAELPVAIDSFASIPKVPLGALHGVAERPVAGTASGSIRLAWIPFNTQIIRQLLRILHVSGE